VCTLKSLNLLNIALDPHFKFDSASDQKFTK